MTDVHKLEQAMIKLARQVKHLTEVIDRIAPNYKMHDQYSSILCKPVEVAPGREYVYPVTNAPEDLDELTMRFRIASKGPDTINGWAYILRDRHVQEWALTMGLLEWQLVCGGHGLEWMHQAFKDRTGQATYGERITPEFPAMIHSELFIQTGRTE